MGDPPRHHSPPIPSTSTSPPPLLLRKSLICAGKPLPTVGKPPLFRPHFRPHLHPPQHHSIRLHHLPPFLRRRPLRHFSGQFKPRNVLSLQGPVHSVLLLAPQREILSVRPGRAYQELLQAHSGRDSHSMERRHCELQHQCESLWVSPFLFGREIAVRRWENRCWN